MSHTSDHFFSFATEFKLRMVDPIPRRNSGYNQFLDFQKLQRKFRTDPVFGKRGVYVIGLRAGQGAIRPMYVGRTTRGSFRSRLIRGHKAEQIGGYYGTPILFLLYPETGRGRTDAIHELEDHLIIDAYQVNPEVMNDKGKLRFRYKILGAFPATPGRNETVTSFRGMIGW